MDPSWISAVAAAFSAIAAAFTSARASREMTRWRDQRRDTKQSDVAGEVLVAALRYLAVLERVTSIAVGTDPEDGQDDRQLIQADTQRRAAEIAEATPRFVTAWEQAEVWLPDEIGKFLQRVWDVGEDIRFSQMIFAGKPADHADRFFAETFKEGFGPIPRKRVVALRDEVRTLLRPLAQLHPVKRRAGKALVTAKK